MCFNARSVLYDDSAIFLLFICVCLDIIKVSAKWYYLLIYLKINKVYVELIGEKRLLAESH